MTPSNAAKEGEPVRRWTTTLYVNSYGSVVHTAWRPGLEPFEVIKLADHEKAVADLREEIALVSEQRDMIDAAGEAALLAARQVDEAMVERAAKTLAPAKPDCYCDDDWREPPFKACPRHGTGFDHWMSSYRRTARAALLAALNAEPEGESMSEHRTDGQQIPDEMRERATAYMRRWWSTCDRTQREHGTGIAWLADHMLNVAGVPDLLAKVDQLRAEIVWLNRRMSEMADDALNPTEEVQAETIHSLAIRFTEQEAELHRLREISRAVIEAFDEVPSVFEPHCVRLRALRTALTPESEAER